MRWRSSHSALTFLATLMIVLTVGGAIACQFHPVSSEHGREHESPIGHQQNGHSDGISCPVAELPDDLMRVALTFVSWVALPIDLHATSFVSPFFIPSRYPA